MEWMTTTWGFSVSENLPEKRDSRVRDGRSAIFYWGWGGSGRPYWKTRPNSGCWAPGHAPCSLSFPPRQETRVLFSRWEN